MRMSMLSFYHCKTKRPVKGVLLESCFALRDPADLDRVGPFRAVSDLKSQSVTFAEFVERYADEIVGVEKEILFLPLALDEPETLVGETSYSSCLHSCRGRAIKS